MDWARKYYDEGDFVKCVSRLKRLGVDLSKFRKSFRDTTQSKKRFFLKVKSKLLKQTFYISTESRSIYKGLPNFDLDFFNRVSRYLRKVYATEKIENDKATRKRKQ